VVLVWEQDAHIEKRRAGLDVEPPEEVDQYQTVTTMMVMVDMFTPENSLQLVSLHSCQLVVQYEESLL